MGTKTTSITAWIALLLTIDYVLSDQSSGILSNLYKKAAEENRPMILVLDHKSANKDLDSSNSFGYQKNHDIVVKKQLDYNKNGHKSWPYSLLQHLGPDTHINHRHSHALDHDHELSKQRQEGRAKSRLQSQLDRDDRIIRGERDDRRDRDRRNRYRNSRDRRDRIRDDRNRRDRDRDDSDRDNRSRYDRDRKDRTDRDRRDRNRDDNDRRDRDRFNSDRRDRDRYSSDRRDRDRDDSDRRDHDRYDRDDNYRSIDHTLRTLIKKTLDKEPEEKASDDPTTHALRSSVIKNLLRAANDLNCEAKDECQDECSEKKKKNVCEDKCEKAFTCDEEAKDDCDGNDCDQEDECGEDNEDCGGDEDENPSTRGVKYEDEEKGECKRC